MPISKIPAEWGSAVNILPTMRHSTSFLFAIAILIGLCVVLSSSKKKRKKKRKKNTTTGFSAEDRLAAFNDWLEDCSARAGLEPLKVEVKEAPGMGYGVFAKQSIAREELYSVIPWECLITYDSIRASPLQRAFDNIKRDTGKQDDFHELLFFLIHEAFINPNSFYKPYIDTIPRTFEFPYYWPNSDIELFRDSLLYHDIIRTRDEAERKYKSVIEFITQREPELFPRSVFTLKNYRWAHTILNSRSIWLQNLRGKRSLIPLLDMVNCGEDTAGAQRVHYSIQDESMGKLKGGASITRAPLALSAGDQIFENYGSPNHIYMLFHGFYLPSNSYDCVLVRLDMEKSERDYDAKSERLREAGFRVPGQNFCLSVKKLDSDDKLRRFLGIIRPGESVASALSPFVRKAKSRYRTWITQDKKKMATETLSDHERTAMGYLLTEKIALRDVDQEIRNRIKKETPDEL